MIEQKYYFNLKISQYIFLSLVICSKVILNDIFYSEKVSNSEIGFGALKVEPLVYRLICKNGTISRDYAHKKYHTGRNVEDTDNAYELYSNETLEVVFFSENKKAIYDLWQKINDYINNSKINSICSFLESLGYSEYISYLP